MRKILLLCLCLPIFQVTNAQDEIAPADLEQLQLYEDTIALMSFLVVNDSLPENRFASCKKVISTLVKALKFENSFQYKFPKVTAISIQYPKDSTFRIFTWQLYVDVDEYRYYGAIQMNSPDLELFPLVDRSFEVEEEEYEILTAKNWYGALYYNIHQFESPKGKRYLLFGYDAYSFFEKRKLVDVLFFREGQPVFGDPIFQTYDLRTGQEFVKNRLVKTYNAEAAFKLNFDEVYNVILFDHLIMMGGMAGQGPSYVPDGSYEGYRLDKGFWHHVPKMFHETSEEAPRDFPILDERNSGDIFGKRSKKKDG